MASSELREAYKALVDEHVAMKSQLDRSMKEFKRAFKKCRPGDEASLASKFAAILSALRACRDAAGPIAAEKLSVIDG